MPNRLFAYVSMEMFYTTFGFGHIPYQLANVVVLETGSGKRILVRSDAVKMIEEIE